jgi:hypothetical protein
VELTRNQFTIRSEEKRKTDQESSEPRKEPWPNQFHSSTETRIPTPDQKSKSKRKKRAPDQKSKSKRKKRALDQKSKSKRKRKNPKRKRKQVVHGDPSK